MDEFVKHAREQGLKVRVYNRDRIASQQLDWMEFMDRTQTLDPAVVVMPDEHQQGHDLPVGRPLAGPTLRGDWRTRKKGDR